MTAKNQRTVAAREAAVAAPATFELLTELGRQQLAIAAEGACALFRGSENMRRIQQQAAHQACSHYEAAAQKLRDTPDAAGLMAIPSELLRFDLQEASQYWQQLAETALKTQIDLMGTAGQMLSTGASSGLKPALQAWQTAVSSPAAQVPAVLKPVFDTWQSAMAGSLNGQEARAAH